MRWGLLIYILWRLQTFLQSAQGRARPFLLCLSGALSPACSPRQGCCGTPAHPSCPRGPFTGSRPISQQVVLGAAALLRVRPLPAGQHGTPGGASLTTLSSRETGWPPSAEGSHCPLTLAFVSGPKGFPDLPGSWPAGLELGLASPPETGARSPQIKPQIRALDQWSVTRPWPFSFAENTENSETSIHEEEKSTVCVDRHTGRLRERQSCWVVSWWQFELLSWSISSRFLWSVVLTSLVCSPYLVCLRILPSGRTHLLAKIDFTDQGLNPHLLHWQVNSSPLSH